MEDFKTRKTLKEKQEEQLKKIEGQSSQLRDTIEILAKTKEGELFLRFLFLSSGGDDPLTAFDSKNRLDVEQTLMIVGRRGLYSDIRKNMSSDVIKLVERHNWE